MTSRKSCLLTFSLTENFGDVTPPAVILYSPSEVRAEKSAM